MIIFYLHMSLMVLMCVCIICAVLIARKRGEGWLPKHRAFAVFGAACGLIGISLMFYSKTVQGWPHFKTPHAVGGGIAALLLMLTPLLGYLSLKGKNALRPFHRILGRLTAILSLLVLSIGIVYLLKNLGLIKK